MRFFSLFTAGSLVFLIFNFSYRSISDKKQPSKEKVLSAAATAAFDEKLQKIINYEYITVSATPLPTATPTVTPRPTITPTPIPAGSLEELFTKYSNHYSVSRDLLKKIAYCESRFNSQARNGIYGGLFQFSENTWQSVRRTMNIDTNPQLRFQPEEAIKTAAFKIAIGGLGAWPNCH